VGGNRVWVGRSECVFSSDCLSPRLSRPSWSLYAGEGPPEWTMGVLTPRFVVYNRQHGSNPLRRLFIHLFDCLTTLLRSLDSNSAKSHPVHSNYTSKHRPARKVNSLSLQKCMAVHLGQLAGKQLIMRVLKAGNSKGICPSPFDESDSRAYTIRCVIRGSSARNRASFQYTKDWCVHVSTRSMNAVSGVIVRLCMQGYGSQILSWDSGLASSGPTTPAQHHGAEGEVL